MRKNRVIEQNRCYHLVSRLAHRAFFLDAVGVFLLRRRPPPWGWCGLFFFFVDPHGLPLFFADPVDITISAPKRKCRCALKSGNAIMSV